MRVTPPQLRKVFATRRAESAIDLPCATHPGGIVVAAPHNSETPYRPACGTAPAKLRSSAVPPVARRQVGTGGQHDPSAAPAVLEAHASERDGNR